MLGISLELHREFFQSCSENLPMYYQNSFGAPLGTTSGFFSWICRDFFQSSSRNSLNFLYKFLTANSRIHLEILQNFLLTSFFFFFIVSWGVSRKIFRSFFRNSFGVPAWIPLETFQEFHQSPSGISTGAPPGIPSDFFQNFSKNYLEFHKFFWWYFEIFPTFSPEIPLDFL